MTKIGIVKRVSLDFPDYIINEIDKFCKENFITRRKWFIDAAREKIARDNLSKIDTIVKR